MMNADDFRMYIDAKASGMTSAAAYKLAEQRGMDTFARLRMLQKVFGMTVSQAKEVSVSDQSDSLDEHQQKLLVALMIAFDAPKNN